VTAAHEAIQATIAEVERLRKLVSQNVSSASELDVIKANVHTWLHTRRIVLAAAVGEQSLGTPDSVLD
jgi:hypothetical protein